MCAYLYWHAYYAAVGIEFLYKLLVKLSRTIRLVSFSIFKSTHRTFHKIQQCKEERIEKSPNRDISVGPCLSLSGSSVFPSSRLPVFLFNLRSNRSPFFTSFILSFQMLRLSVSLFTSVRPLISSFLVLNISPYTSSESA